MDAVKTKKLLSEILALYAVLACLIFIIGFRSFRMKEIKRELVSSTGNTVELTDGMDISQPLYAPAETITGMQIRFGLYGMTDSGMLYIKICNNQNKTIAEKAVNIVQLKDKQINEITFDTPILCEKNEPVFLHLSSEGCSAGHSVTILTGHFDGQSQPYKINGIEQTGILCADVIGEVSSNAWIWYWGVCALILGIGILAVVRSWNDAVNGKENLLSDFSAFCIKYRFLMKQLIIRDFKTKYKRSILGVGWSFLNPLLTMSVQYIVFNTLFRSDIPNYPVYLLIGIVFMNYFSEAITLGMNSITGNSSLIKKVMVPKYVFSISRVISSLINFGYALIPLGIVILLTRVEIHLSIILLIFDVMCLFGFVLGMVFLFATSMTFFQDTQFLWSVISLLWMYLTPVFYPETIIPSVIRPIYRLNPMYQYISFARTCIIFGQAPAPEAYLGCFLSSLAVLSLGVSVFRKYQDQFVLYL